MYKTLLKLKNRIDLDDWRKMVDQAAEKGKLTEDEYKKLLDTTLE